MSTPAIPSKVPKNRLQFLTTRDLEGGGLSAISFCYMADSEEWVVEDSTDRQMILKQYPEAKFFEP